MRESEPPEIVRGCTRAGCALGDTMSAFQPVAKPDYFPAVAKGIFSSVFPPGR